MNNKYESTDQAKDQASNAISPILGASPRKSVDLLNKNDLSACTILDLDNNDKFLSNELNQSAESITNKTNEQLKPTALINKTTQLRSVLDERNQSEPSRLDLSKIKQFQAQRITSPATIALNDDSLTSSRCTTATKNIYYICAHCQYRFVFNDLANKIVKCPGKRLLSFFLIYF